MGTKKLLIPLRASHRCLGQQRPELPLPHSEPALPKAVLKRRG